MFAAGHTMRVPAMVRQRTDGASIEPYIGRDFSTMRAPAQINDETVHVETFKGVVQLSGFVSSQANISKAAEVARSVGGVTRVRNDMRLK